jgi:transmembrane sensor
MPDQSSRLQYLLQQYADNSCTRAELLELLEALKQEGDTGELQEAMKVLWEQVRADDQLAGLNREHIFSRVIQSGKVHELPPREFNFVRWGTAAAILLVVGFGIYFSKTIHPPAQISKTHPASIILPGTNKAVLTLANGQKVVLDNSSSGQISTDGSTTTIRLDKGRLAYAGQLKGRERNSPGFNLLSTPAGGQYQIILPDGTKVWLNAASSLRFPVLFADDSRQVELMGEGYFEVAKNKAKPFRIAVNGEEIKVLGTHFNVMGYSDEASTITTLLEGSVQIAKGRNVRKIVPGEQAIVGDEIQVAKVDVSEAIQWKNGNFNFSHEKIQRIMRKLSRWYNIDVEYQGKITGEGFVGTVPRSKNLSEVLNTLESTGLVHFKIKERRVIVMP